ncbi:hypothetical protein F2Q70_00029285 [Brassica cretica]|uniref:Uncharacterized protein n=1 Tax=Brassica cretica TaxID=69181 RepID=A0A8S9FF35_BRACR|nr:hypothetical protein F2Q70_00029285 [Brassica cretica]KAF3594643.1 hypothetical protein DY000_02020674 [Brassica cretica]
MHCGKLSKHITNIAVHTELDYEMTTRLKNLNSRANYERLDPFDKGTWAAFTRRSPNLIAFHSQKNEKTTYDGPCQPLIPSNFPNLPNLPSHSLEPHAKSSQFKRAEGLTVGVKIGHDGNNV